MYNAVRGTARAKRFFHYPENAKEDVVFDLVELERVPIGDPFSVTVTIQVIECVLFRLTLFLFPFAAASAKNS